MSLTARLDLPLIASEQAQKHVTHNEALLLLDALVHIRLAALAQTEPPADPQPGATYGIAAEAGGAWSGKDGKIAAWSAGGWRFVQPENGWLGWDISGAQPVVYKPPNWVPLFNGLNLVGIGTDADSTNRLAVRSEAALFTAIPAGEGGNGNVRLTLNKETQSDSATVIFQAGWSGRAEIGLSGSDDFAFKVSEDGASFKTAMTLETSTGFVGFASFAGCAVSFPGIAGGILNAATGYVVPAPESGTADEVDTIAGGFDGAVLIVTGTSGNVLTFKDGTGNLKLGGDRLLDAFDDSLMLVRRGGDWIELSFSDNG
ncbi:DUF2793 domain-containing protein [Pelagibacterium sp.]|uniref:DUF2793 domain-containing protein n=1 Tax=Pelagibacterium sp. TaxID=1967288 RepID=UPI003A907F2C